MSYVGTVLDEAQRVVEQRQTNDAGSRERNFSDIAAFWSVILRTPVTPQQVALCMIALKITRELFRPQRDNLVDICGYAHCLEDLINGSNSKMRHEVIAMFEGEIVDPEPTGAGFDPALWDGGPNGPRPGDKCPSGYK